MKTQDLDAKMNEAEGGRFQATTEDWASVDMKGVFDTSPRDSFLLILTKIPWMGVAPVPSNTGFATEVFAHSLPQRGILSPLPWILLFSHVVPLDGFCPHSIKQWICNRSFRERLPPGRYLFAFAVDFTL